MSHDTPSIQVSETNSADRIVELQRLLTNARERYYRGDPVMSDPTYDGLEDELRRLVPTSLGLSDSILTTVGSDLGSGTQRWAHSVPMLSLDKVTTGDTLEEWLSGIPDDTYCSIEPKVDGCSCALIYSDWKLVRALSRGDGTMGEDMTQAASTSTQIPKILDPIKFPATLEVRGELWISTHTLERLNKEVEASGSGTKYANTRNLVAGTAKIQGRLDDIRNRELKFQPWQVLGLEDRCTSPYEALRYIQQHAFFAQDKGLVVPKDNVVKRVMESGQALRNSWKSGQGMITDGVVIKVDDYKIIKTMGLKSTSPRWACAYKFPAETAETTVLDVLWQTGRSGIVTPVCLMDPVNVSGASVQRAALNNITYIDNLGLQIGDKVLIKRSGEVIPFVDQVSYSNPNGTKIVPPTHCPECNNTLTSETDPSSEITKIYCTNDECPARVREYLKFISDRKILDIDGLGDELADRLARRGVTSIAKLYAWVERSEQFLATKGEEAFNTSLRKNGISVAAVKKLMKSLNEAKTTRSIDRWLVALGIDGIGSTLSKQMAIHLGLTSEDCATLGDRVQTLSKNPFDGLGDKKLATLLGWFSLESNRQMLVDMVSYGIVPVALVNKLATGETPLAGMNVCITGTFPWDRDKIAEKLIELGAAVKGVNKKLTYLIAGTEPGPKKITMANSLGIQIVDIVWLKKLFSDNKISMGE